ncbi:GLABROUS1 enhancer-binding protein-like [Vicia villosa]|uniref:GLABROUS1 enhancer-binding protein-like n=1 Tax=Vicia villosa TaxID=3911 RepID=UPI00273B6728|nr:GLABROUS1 enhancer-binding protein-like [Vicia villosa]
MAPPKRLRITPLDDPPTASSSSDEDQPPSSKKPEDDVVDEEDSEEAGEETDQNEEDDEDEDEGSSSEEEQVQPPSKNPPPSTPISNPKPDSGSKLESGAESGSESGSESDSEQEPTPPNAKVKPLASKPMKTQAQSTPVPARSGTKRANENGSKSAKKKTTATGGGSENEADGDGDVKMTGEDSKKMNQRVFTEGDEIAILKGLADFISKTGKDPMKDLVGFHSFVKKSIHRDATTEQLKRKVRGLKMKFKDGGSFTKEHDKKAFELSKKVWGNTEGNNNVGNEGEAPVRNNGSAKKEKVVKNGARKDEGGVDRSLALSEMRRFDEAAGLSLLNVNAMERGIGLLEESMVDEFNEGWRKVQIAEMELFVTRGQLVTDQARIALDALKKTR